MRIAYLGWGSLIWDPRTLSFAGKWFDDGPLLPIEFCRQSNDGRITLVLVPGVSEVRALWSLSTLKTVEEAIQDLAMREGIEDKNIAVSVGVWRAEVDAGPPFPSIQTWAKRQELDAVVWTNLKSRLGGTVKTPSIQEILAHLRGLPVPQRRVAEEYVRKAPLQIDTAYRREIEKELGWKPIM